jgi:hypothetical protein
LSKDSIGIASKPSISFCSYETIEDEQDHLNSLRQANALFTYAQRTMCTCAQCAPCFTQKQNKFIDKSGRYNRMAICLNNIKPAQRLAANQRNRLNTSERDYAVSRATVMRLCRLLPNRFWSHLNRELARRCMTQSNEGD